MAYLDKTQRPEGEASRLGDPHETARADALGAIDVSRGRAATGARTTPGSARRRPAGRPYERSRDWDRIGAFAGGLALGALLGAGTALLLAPASGEEAREWIAEGARGLGSRAHDAWDDLRAGLAWAARRGRRRIRRAATRGRWAAEDLWDRELRGHR
jgi:hypothetical protein